MNQLFFVNIFQQLSISYIRLLNSPAQIRRDVQLSNDFEMHHKIKSCVLIHLETEKSEIEFLLKLLVQLGFPDDGKWWKVGIEFDGKLNVDFYVDRL